MQDEGNFSGGENDTILIVKKPAPGKPVTETSPVSSTETSAPPPKLAPVEPPQPKPRRSIAGMNFLTLEEMVEADTDLIHNPNSKGPPPDNSNN